MQRTATYVYVYELSIINHLSKQTNNGSVDLYNAIILRRSGGAYHNNGITRIAGVILRRSFDVGRTICYDDEFKLSRLPSYEYDDVITRFILRRMDVSCNSIARHTSRRHVSYDDCL